MTIGQETLPASLTVTHGQKWSVKMAKPKTSPAAPIIRTSAGLRDAIFDEIDAIRSGNSNPTRANAVAKLATGIVETVRMEVEVQRHLRQQPNGEAAAQLPAALGMPLSLGQAA